MNRIASVTASKKNGAKKHGALRHMELKKAENGMTSQMQFDPDPNAKDGDKYGDHLNPPPTVHVKQKHMLDHIKAQTAGFFPGAAGAAAPATPAAAPAAAAPAEPDEDDE